MKKKLFQTISQMKIGTVVTIQKITAKDELKQRLLALGFIRGNSIKLCAISLAKESVIVEVSGSTGYALRDAEARHILVS